jgi:hypothetical protein
VNLPYVFAEHLGPHEMDHLADVLADELEGATRSPA